MNRSVRKYLSHIGTQGGRKSRRRLSSATARAMVRVRDAKRAYKNFHAQCFWSYDPNYVIGAQDVEWVANQLVKHGDRKAWQVAARLCR